MRIENTLLVGFSFFVAVQPLFCIATTLSDFLASCTSNSTEQLECFVEKLVVLSAARHSSVTGQVLGSNVVITGRPGAALDLANATQLLTVPPIGHLALRNLTLYGVSLSKLHPASAPETFMAPLAITLGRGAKLSLRDVTLVTPSCLDLYAHQYFACKASPSPNFTVRPTSLTVHTFSSTATSLVDVRLVCSSTQQLPSPLPCTARTVTSGTELVEALAVSPQGTELYLHVPNHITFAGVSTPYTGPKDRPSALPQPISAPRVVIAGPPTCLNAGSVPMPSVEVDLAGLPYILPLDSLQGHVVFANLTLTNLPFGGAVDMPDSLFSAMVWSFDFVRQAFGSRLDERLVLQNVRLRLATEELATWAAAKFFNSLSPALPRPLDQALCAFGERTLTSFVARLVNGSGASGGPAVIVIGANTAGNLLRLENVLLTDEPSPVWTAMETPCGPDSLEEEQSYECNLLTTSPTKPVSGSSTSTTSGDPNRVDSSSSGNSSSANSSSTGSSTGRSGTLNYTCTCRPPQIRITAAGPLTPPTSAHPVCLLAPLGAHEATRLWRVSRLNGPLYPADLMRPAALDEPGAPPVALRAVLRRSMTVMSLPTRRPIYSFRTRQARVSGPASVLGHPKEPLFIDFGAAAAEGINLAHDNASLTLRTIVLLNLPPAGIHPAVGPDPTAHANSEYSDPPEALDPPSYPAAPIGVPAKSSMGSEPDWAYQASQGLPPGLANFTSCVWPFYFNRVNKTVLDSTEAAAVAATYGVEVSAAAWPAGPPRAYLESVTLVVPPEEVALLAWVLATRSTAVISDPLVATHIRTAILERSRLAGGDVTRGWLAGAVQRSWVCPSNNGDAAPDDSNSADGTQLAAAPPPVAQLTFAALEWCGLHGRNVTFAAAPPDGCPYTWQRPARALQLPIDCAVAPAPTPSPASPSPASASPASDSVDTITAPPNGPQPPTAPSHPAQPTTVTSGAAWTPLAAGDKAACMAVGCTEEGPDDTVGRDTAGGPVGHGQQEQQGRGTVAVAAGVGSGVMLCAVLASVMAYLLHARKSAAVASNGGRGGGGGTKGFSTESSFRLWFSRLSACGHQEQPSGQTGLVAKRVNGRLSGLSSAHRHNCTGPEALACVLVRDQGQERSSASDPEERGEGGGLVVRPAALVTTSVRSGDPFQDVDQEGREEMGSSRDHVVGCGAAAVAAAAGARGSIGASVSAPISAIGDAVGSSTVVGDNVNVNGSGGDVTPSYLSLSAVLPPSWPAAMPPHGGVDTEGRRKAEELPPTEDLALRGLAEMCERVDRIREGLIWAAAAPSRDEGPPLEEAPRQQQVQKGQTNESPETAWMQRQQEQALLQKHQPQCQEQLSVQRTEAVCQEAVEQRAAAGEGTRLNAAAATHVQGWVDKEAFPDPTPRAMPPPFAFSPSSVELHAGSRDCRGSFTLAAGGGTPARTGSRTSDTSRQKQQQQHQPSAAPSGSANPVPEHVEQEALWGIGALRVVGQLGRGAQGRVVCRGVWRGLDVAVKSFLFMQGPAGMPNPLGGGGGGGDNHSSATACHGAGRRALQEAALALCCRHPNILATYTHALQPLTFASNAGGDGGDGVPYTVVAAAGEQEAAAAGSRGGGAGGGTWSSQNLSGLESLLADEWSWEAGGRGGAPTQAPERPVEAAGGGGGGPPPVVVEAWRLVLVQEYCDGSSLHHSLLSGALAAADPSPPPLPPPATEGTQRIHLTLPPEHPPPHPAPSSPSPAPLHVALLIALDVARGMAHLHRCGVVHGDLGSANVLLARRPLRAAVTQPAATEHVGFREERNGPGVGSVNDGRYTKPPSSHEERRTPMFPLPPAPAAAAAAATATVSSNAGFPSSTQRVDDSTPLPDSGPSRRLCNDGSADGVGGTGTGVEAPAATTRANTGRGEAGIGMSSHSTPADALLGIAAAEERRAVDADAARVGDPWVSDALAVDDLRMSWGLGYVAKVCDFGLAGRLRDGDQTHLSGPTRRFSLYSAPELVRDGTSRRPSDVYAFAVLLWEVATGCPLPEAMTATAPQLKDWLREQSRAALRAAQQQILIAQQGLPPLAAQSAAALPLQLLPWPPGMPAEYVDLVGECLRERPEERPTFAEVCGRLEGMARELAAAEERGRSVNLVG